MRVPALLLSFFALKALGACPVLGVGPTPPGDALYRLLAGEARCPARAQELTAALSARGLAARAALVANRGRHNPKLGSFSFFEGVTGDLDGTFPVREGEFFFGHFTDLAAGEIVLDQSPAHGKLLVELIAWDPGKGMFNFYELIGTSASARWHYRGDSADAIRDNAYLHRTPPAGTPKFGRAMRCSACHGSGGPIMKELAAPHNDWWTRARPLSFGANRLSPEVRAKVTVAVDASDFSRAVVAGIRRLEESPSFKAFKRTRPRAERLRPLYCENEINLESDDGASPDEVRVPSAFLKNPLLGKVSVTLDRIEYGNRLERHGMRFPETTRRDADHAFLVPVKGYSDLLAIRSLIAEGVVTEAQARAVLALDAEHPLFSKQRCALLEGRTEAPEPSLGLFEKMIRTRRAVFESEISRNPLGQILEPGFRVIFPQATQ